MNIKELVESWEGKSKEQIIESLMNELEEINKEKKENTNMKWKPKNGEIYFYINHSGDIICDTYIENTYEDNWRYLINNCFKTEKEAVEYQKKLGFQAKFRNYVEEHNYKINWTSESQIEYYIYYNYKDNKIGICSEYTQNKNQGTIYSSNREILADVIKELGEDNIKKYILEVE